MAAVVFGYRAVKGGYYCLPNHLFLLFLLRSYSIFDSFFPTLSIQTFLWWVMLSRAQCREVMGVFVHYLFLLSMTKRPWRLA
ncbi:hypothetical protein IMCC21906_01443 [Spongiibacter sp. IMCC21906]|nr:hypothetical protein IMCC21906_01443 [Spongiibacter sp. IMCC21906]